MRKVCAAVLICITLGASASGQERGGDLRPVRQLPSAEKRWALLVGVSDYEDGNITDLNGAADARVLRDALVRYAGFPENQIILLTTDQPRERRPTRENIIKRLSDLKRSVPPDGLLLFSFSGHGTESGGQAFLMPSAMFYDDDFETLKETAVSVEFVKRQIRAMKVPQVLILLDACRSDPLNSASDSANPLTEAYRRGFSFDVRNREVTAFATLYATSVGARAYEYGEKGLGYFTWAVVEALKGGAANERGEVTLHELKKFVEQHVPREVRRRLGKVQQPSSIIEGYKDDELVLAVTSAAPPNPPAPRPDAGRDSAFYLVRGVGHYDLENYDQAISDLGMAVQLDSQNVEAYSSLCAAYRGKGDFNQAIASCNKALRLDPKHANAYNNLGTVYYELHKYGQAIENYNTAISLDPDNASPYGSRCAAYLDQGDTASAIKDCEKAIRLDAGQVNAYNNLGTAYYRSRDYARATRNFETAIKLDAHYERAYSGLCAVYVDTGALSQAVNTCQKAIQLKPDHANAYNNLGVAYYRLSRYDDAVENLSRAIELDGRHLEAHNNLGVVHFARGEYAQAVDRLTQAIRINPRYADAYRSRADAHKRLGNQKQAQEDLKKAEELEGSGAKP